MLATLILAAVLQAGGPTLVNTGQAIGPNGFLWQRGAKTVYASPGEFELQVYDAETQSSFSTGLMVSDGPYLFGDLVLFLVDEASLGQDLDQDGETDDLIYHVLDLTTLAVTSLNLPGFSYFGYVFGSRVPSRFLGFLVQESDAGDLNGDGDVSDDVAHVYDAETGEVRNLGLATDQLPLAEGDQVFVYVNEFAQGQTDLNGDGLLFGSLFQHDFPANVTTNTGFAGWKGPPGLAFLPEGPLGEDLNGDGIVSNGTLYYALDSGANGPQPLGIGAALPFVQSAAGFSALPVTESASEIDLNGDGDLGDRTVLGWFPRTGQVERLGLGGGGPVSTHRQGDRVSVLALVAEEFEQIDVTGDGDASDFVARYWDSAMGIETLPLPANGSTVRGEGALVTFHMFEQEFGTDVDGDGQLTSFVQVVHDFSLDRTWIFPWTGLVWVTGGVLYAQRGEVFEGQDLNGDGSIDAVVLFSLDPATGIETVYPVSVEVEAGTLDTTFLSSNGYLAVSVLETDIDLNGDGDTDDFVLHVAVP